MIERTSGATGAPKKYTVADLYGEAKGLLDKEMRGLKGLSANEALPEVELEKMDALAKLIANTVLKDMNIA